MCQVGQMSQICSMRCGSKGNTPNKSVLLVKSRFCHADVFVFWMFIGCALPKCLALHKMASFFIVYKEHVTLVHVLGLLVQLKGSSLPPRSSSYVCATFRA